MRKLGVKENDLNNDIFLQIVKVPNYSRGRTVGVNFPLAARVDLAKLSLDNFLQYQALVDIFYSVRFAVSEVADMDDAEVTNAREALNSRIAAVVGDIPNGDTSLLVKWGCGVMNGNAFDPQKAISSSRKEDPDKRLSFQRSVENIFTARDRVNDKILNLIDLLKKGVSYVNEDDLTILVHRLRLTIMNGDGRFDYKKMKIFLDVLLMFVDSLRDKASLALISSIFYMIQNFDARVVKTEFIEMLVNLVENCPNNEFNPYLIVSIFSGFMRLDDGVVTHELMQRLLIKVKSTGVTRMLSKDIGKIAVSVTNLGSPVIDKDFMEMMEVWIDECKDEIEWHVVAGIMFSFQAVSAECIDKKWMNKLSNLIRDNLSNEFSDKHLGMIGYGLQNLDSTVIGAHFINILFSMLKRVKHITVSSIGMILYGVSSLEMEVKKPLIDRLFLEMGKINPFEVDDFKGLITLRQAASLNGLTLPANYELAYEDVVKREASTTPGSGEMKFRRFLEQIVPPGTRILFNYFIDGFELDAYLPEYNLNLELDGFDHRGKKLSQDRKRDNYLAEKRNVNVERFGNEYLDDYPALAMRLKSLLK